MSSQNQNAIPPANAAPQPAPPSGGWPIYQSNHAVGKARYITSNDPRGYLPVWEYLLREQPMMMDMDDGFVLWTSICKALGKSKADITRMIESDPELQLPNRLRRVKGGFLRVQGTWIPNANAKALARKIAWEIKDDLVPFFGQDFPSTCLSPNDPGFADILAPRTRARRSTTTAVPGSQPPPSGNSSSQMQGQPWLPSSPPAVQRQNSAGAIMNSYPASPPRANRSPSSTGSPHMQPPHGYQSGAQSGPQGPYRSASGTSSPGTIREEPYGPEGSYPNTPGAYSTTPGYNTQYGATGYQASSAPMYATSPAAAYFQPQYSQSPYGTHQAAQPYSPQVTTPTQTGYPTTEYNNYASHGVSDGPPQPCNTYQDYQDQSRAPAPGYALTPAYPTSQQPGGVYQGQYQSPSSAYPSYANESSVRYTAAETPYSSDTARYGNEGGSSRAEYGYNYGNGSPGMQGQPGQRTHQQPGQYSGAEYRDQQTPGQQPWGGYGGSY